MIRLLFPLLIIGLAGLIFFKFADPVLKEIDGLRVQQDKLNAGLDNAKKLREVQQGLLDTYNSFDPVDIDKLNKMLPDNVDNVRLIIDINNIAKPNNMTIRNIQIKEEDSKSGSDLIQGGNETMKKGSVILGFSVTGPYNNFLTFMSDLAKSLRIVDVTSVSFSSDDKDLSTYSVEIQTYWLK